MNDFNQYAEQTQKLTSRQIWKSVQEYWYQDAAGRYVQKVERVVAVDRVSGKPVLNVQTGKQLKKCIQTYYMPGLDKFALGRWAVIPEHWRPVLYQVLEIIAAIKDKKIIFIVEGENKAEVLRAWGLVATCNAGGAGKWELAHAEELARAELVVILPDNDNPGRLHADIVGRSLERMRVKSIRLLELPNLPERGDVIDWVAADASNTKEKFLELVEAAQPWKPYGPPPSEEPQIANVEVLPSADPIYKVTLSVAGETVGVLNVTARELNRSTAFNEECIKQLRRSFKRMPDNRWAAAVDQALRTAEAPDLSDALPTLRHGQPEWGQDTVEWLTRNRTQKVGVGLTSGQWGTVKTFKNLDEGTHVMMGWSWTGEPVYRRGGVLYFAAEGANTIPDRVAGLVKHKVAPFIDQAGDFFKHQAIRPDHLPFSLVQGCRPLLDPRTVDWIIAKAKAEQEYFQNEFGVDLVEIFIDTMAAAAGWTDENDAAQAQVLMNHAHAIAQATQSFLMLTDHFGKDISAGTRGSVVKETSADIVHALLGERDVSTGLVTDRRLVLRKVRSGPEGLIIPFEVREITIGTDNHNYPKTTLTIDWNVERPAKEERTKRKTDAEEILFQALEQAMKEQAETITYNEQQIEAVRMKLVREIFMKRYRQRKPNAASHSIEEMWRRTYKAAAIGKAMVNGVEYLWSIL